MYYSYLPTYSCQAVCPSPYYGFAGNQSCVSVCPSSPNMTYYDYNNSKCVTTCPANYYAASNQSCLACTFNHTQPVRMDTGATLHDGFA